MRPAVAAAVVIAAGACTDDPTLLFEARPIAVARAPLLPSEPAPAGALLAVRADEVAGSPPSMIIDTGSPYSALSRAACDGTLAGRAGGVFRGALPMGDAAASSTGVLRARFSSTNLLDLCPPALADAGSAPTAILGADLLRRMVVRFDLPHPGTGTPTVRFSDELPANDGTLGATGRAVLRARLRGGGTAQVQGGPSMDLPATRLILRGCAAPLPFDPEGERLSCPDGQLAASATGQPLALLLSTGTGPLVLTDAAWRRVVRQLPGVDPDAGERRPLHWGHAQVQARWVTLPRLALVDQQASAATDPGACAELGRARRIEWAERRFGGDNACFERCDTDGARAETSAGYLELGGGIATAVLDEDAQAALLGIAAEVGVAAPKIDGLLGAGVLSGARIEVDYVSSPDQRVVVSCLDADRARCYAAPSCPRLTASDETHVCFGLPAHGRVPVCP